MTCKVTVQKNILADSLAIVGRAVGNHAHLPVLANVLLSQEDGRLRLSATNLSVGISVWMDAVMDGDPGLTLPGKTLTDVVNALTEPEVIFSVNGKPEAALKCGSFKGVVKGIEASEFPAIPDFANTAGISLDASLFKEMIQKVAFAASMDETRPVLNGVLLSLEGKSISMVGTDGFRLAVYKATLLESFASKQLIIPASTLKEALRILNAVRTSRITLILPTNSNQVVLRVENVQLVSQLVEGKFPDYQAILPKGYKTRTILDAGDLLKACRQASIIAREGNHVLRLHLQPGLNPGGKLKVLAEADLTGASEIELDATIEGQELDIAFNVKFLQEGLETISTQNVVIETNAYNTPAIIRSTGGEENLYVLMPMHIDGR